MARWGVSHILILVLAVGGLFEIIKRLPRPNFSLAPNTTAVEESSPYSRARRNENFATARATARPRFERQAPATRLVRPNPPLIIPATEGKFDAHGPQAVAENKAKQQNQVKAKVDKKEKKKCRRPGEEVEGEERGEFLNQQQSAIELAVNPSPEEQAKKAQSGQEDETEEECIDEQQEVAKAEDDQPQSEEPDDADEISPFDAAPTFGGGLVVNKPQSADMVGLEEWKKRLLDQPNFKETVRLIEAVQRGEISTALFQAIVKLMLEDNRIQIRELGVLAAGRVPSFESFHLLVSVLKQETFGSKLRVRAENELAFYQQLPFLSILENVLRNSSDVFALIWATRTLEDSAKNYLQSKYNRKTPAGTTSNPYLSTYQRFIAVLEELIREGHDNQQVAQARQTLNSLKDLLGALS